METDDVFFEFFFGEKIITQRRREKVSESDKVSRELSNSDFKAFGSKKSCLREQILALKDTFIILHFLFKA